MALILLMNENLMIIYVLELLRHTVHVSFVLSIIIVIAKDLPTHLYTKPVHTSCSPHHITSHTTLIFITINAKAQFAPSINLWLCDVYFTSILKFILYEKKELLQIISIQITGSIYAQKTNVSVF